VSPGVGLPTIWCPTARAKMPSRKKVGDVRWGPAQPPLIDSCNKTKIKSSMGQLDDQVEGASAQDAALVFFLLSCSGIFLTFYKMLLRHSRDAVSPDVVPHTRSNAYPVPRNLDWAELDGRSGGGLCAREGLLSVWARKSLRSTATSIVVSQLVCRRSGLIAKRTTLVERAPADCFHSIRLLPSIGDDGEIREANTPWASEVLHNVGPQGLLQVLEGK
jgi:hypothetical protein